MTSREWFGLLFRQTAYALTTVTGVLLIGEILLPGLVLPFLNLHILVMGTLGVDLFLPVIGTGGFDGTGGFKTRPYPRALVILPIAVLLVVYVFFALAGNGVSAMLLTLAVGVMMLLVGWAVIKPD